MCDMNICLYYYYHGELKLLNNKQQSELAKFNEKINNLNDEEKENINRNFTQSIGIGLDMDNNNILNNSNGKHIDLIPDFTITGKLSFIYTF